VCDVAGVIDSGYSFVPISLWLHQSLPKKANRCDGLPRDEKTLAGFNRPFRFTGQKHICPK